MRTAVENVAGSDIGQARDGIVGGALQVITVGSSLRETIELGANHNIRVAPDKCERFQIRRWHPVVVARRGSEDFNIVGVIGIHDLPSGKQQQVSLETGDIRSVGRTPHLSQAGPIPLEEDGAGLENQGAGHHQHLAVGLQRGRAIGDAEIARKVRTRSPGTRVGVVNGCVGCAAPVRSRREHGAIWEQKRRTCFK